MTDVTHKISCDAFTINLSSFTNFFNMLSPFDQFNLELYQPGILFGMDYSITIMTLQLTLIVIFITLFLWFATSDSKLIATRIQSLAELLYTFVYKLVAEQTGTKGLYYFSFFFTTFLFILTMNLFGLLPFGFTVTGHLVITFTLAISFFTAWILIGIINLREKFLMIFVPSGLPMWLMPLIVVIEIFSFIIRPLSLAIRLFANMLAGHVLLHILASGLLVIADTAIFYNVLPLFIINFFVVLELFIAFVQAYVFTTLLSIYLVDSIYAKHSNKRFLKKVL